MRNSISSPDLLRRFTPTPLATGLCVMGRSLRLETNSPVILEWTRSALKGYGETTSGRPEFLWRLVAETDSDLWESSWPETTALSDQGLSFVSFDQRGFLAVDSGAREGAGFLAEELLQDELEFTRRVLARFFCMTARALGLVPVSAACVVGDKKGILLFGPPKSGKTISSYLAGKVGLNFHADQVVFLDFRGHGLRAWGEFWPAVFYEESRGLLPELHATTRAFPSNGQQFLYLEKSSSPACLTCEVVPALCLFLDSKPAGPLRLIPLGGGKLAARLEAQFLFPDHNDPLEEEARDALCCLTAYHLSHGNDPKAVSIVFRSLLNSLEIIETES